MIQEDEFNIYDFWLKKDLWTIDEAACLLNGIDPRTVDVSKADKNPFTIIQNSNAVDQGYYGTIEVLDILRSVDWTKYDKKPEKNKANYKIFIELAEDKDIKLPSELVESLTKKELAKKSKHPKTDISPKLQETLQPIINVIRNFENCDLYKNNDKKTQQQLIKDWVISKNLVNGKKPTTRFASVLADLISQHYGITTSKK